MNILYCGMFSYTLDKGSLDTLYYSFTDVFTEMGISFKTIDTRKYKLDSSLREKFNENVLNLLKTKKYDAMIVATSGDEFIKEYLDEFRKHTILIAWNSDDDWRWEDYSKLYAPHYDLMYTTYKDVYDNNKDLFTSLRLSQWACLKRFEGYSNPKIMDFSFIGAAYGERRKLFYNIKKQIKEFEFYGVGSFHFFNNYKLDYIIRKFNNGLKKYFKTSLFNEYLSVSEISKIWSSTKISLNLMKSSTGDRYQIKSRTFEMGLSGTAMICEKSPNIEMYYEPDKEFIKFTDFDELIDKVKYYLKNEKDLSNIASNYYNRTKKEHLWEYRIRQIFKDAGLTIN